ncbi:MAG: hypothetical protein EXR99_09590 [Gemmataceae bacterium]|nr:hypothetical protein [Gemmataceae bacterium]
MARSRPGDDEPNVKLILMSALAVVLFLIVGGVWFFSGESGGSVSGKVTLNGEVVDRARVVFEIQGENRAGPFQAQTNDMGEYQLFGSTSAKVPLGNYKVSVVKLTLRGGQVPVGEKALAFEEKGQLSNILPKTYESMETTPLQREVRSGRNSIDLDLKK